MWSEYESLKNPEKLLTSKLCHDENCELPDLSTIFVAYINNTQLFSIKCVITVNNFTAMECMKLKIFRRCDKQNLKWIKIQKFPNSD
jgi:hypothetical protein